MCAFPKDHTAFLFIFHNTPVIAREQRDRGNPCPVSLRGAQRRGNPHLLRCNASRGSQKPQENGFPHQCAHWFGMTEKTSPLYVIARSVATWQSPAIRFPVHRSSRNAATLPREIPTGLTALGMTKRPHRKQITGRIRRSSPWVLTYFSVRRLCAFSTSSLTFKLWGQALWHHSQCMQSSPLVRRAL